MSILNYTAPVLYINYTTPFKKYNSEEHLKNNCTECKLHAGAFVNIQNYTEDLNGLAEYIGCNGATLWKNIYGEKIHNVFVQILNGYKYHNEIRLVISSNLKKL